MEPNQYPIDLKQLQHHQDIKLDIRFKRVPPTSFLTVDKRIHGEFPVYYENLLEVTVRHETYVFNIMDNKY